MSSYVPPMPPMANITNIYYPQAEDDDSSFESSLIAFIVIFAVFMVAVLAGIFVLWRYFRLARRVKQPPAMPVVAPSVVGPSHFPGLAPPNLPLAGEAPRQSLPPVRVMEGPVYTMQSGMHGIHSPPTLTTMPMTGVMGAGSRLDMPNAGMGATYAPTMMSDGAGAPGDQTSVRSGPTPTTTTTTVA